MNYPMEKYKFYSNGKKVIAVSTYAGKTVRGVATCNSGDAFDMEKGKRLAAARCNEKVAEKRLKRAARKRAEALQFSIAAKRKYAKMSGYFDDASKELNSAQRAVAEVLENL